MKYYQMKSMFFSLILLVAIVSLRFYQKGVIQRELLVELDSLICSESVLVNIDTDIVGVSEAVNETSRSVEKQKKKSKVRRRDITVPVSMLEINSANRNELMKLKGIGQVLSDRIIKFRTKLGGFHSVDQLKDVYGLETETYNRIKSRLECNGEIKQIDLVEDDFKTILKHPYLNYEEVKSIKNYLKHQKISSVEDLVASTSKTIMNASRLWPYIKTKTKNPVVKDVSLKINP